MPLLSLGSLFCSIVTLLIPVSISKSLNYCFIMHLDIGKGKFQFPHIPLAYWWQMKWWKWDQGQRQNSGEKIQYLMCVGESARWLQKNSEQMCKRSQVRTKKHPLNLAECQFGVVGVGSTRFLLTQIIIGQKYNSYIYIYIYTT